MALEGRLLGRHVVDGVVVSRETNKLRHLPLARCYGVEATLRDRVQVEVEPACCGLLAHNEAVVVDEGDCSLVGTLHIALILLVVDNALCAISLNHDHLEVVLEAVDAIEEEVARWCVAEAWDILVGSLAYGHLACLAAIEVVDMERNDRVVVTSLGILEAVSLVVERVIEAHHLELLNAALVKLEVCNLAAVVRESVCLGEAILLLVDPVGSTVDDVVPLAIRGDVVYLVCHEVVDEEIVVVAHREEAVVGRERYVAHIVNLDCRAIGA